MEKEILDILEKFKDTDNCYGSKDVYLEYIKIGEEEVSFEEEILKTFKKLNITEYDFCWIGGFESCGYTIRCSCISYINKEGKLITIPVKYEY